MGIYTTIPFQDYTCDGQYVWFLMECKHPNSPAYQILTRWYDWEGIALEDDGYIRNIVLPMQRILWEHDDLKITWCRVCSPCEYIFYEGDTYAVSLDYNV